MLMNISCTKVNDDFITKADGSGYIVYVQFMHHTQINLCQNITCSFLVLSSVLISNFQITYVYIVVARWMYLRQKWCLGHELQLSDYFV